MLNHVKSILSDMLLHIRSSVKHRQLETLSEYWEFVLQETKFKHSKYKLINSISVRPNGEYATQFVQDRTTLDRYTLKIPKSSLYDEIKTMYSSILADNENLDLLEEYADLLSSVHTWLFKLESQFDYSLAKPYSATYIQTL